MSTQTTARDEDTPLRGKRIAALVADGFEHSELFGPKDALTAAGATVEIVSPNTETVRSWHSSDWGESIKVDVPLEKADSKTYTALLLPGGVKSPDTLRMSRKAVEFVRHFLATGKPVGAICHAPWLLIEAEAVEGVALTSYPSLRTDLLNAGALWLDKAVVTDKGIVTSRRPSDIPAFSAKLIEEIAEGPYSTRAARAA